MKNTEANSVEIIIEGTGGIHFGGSDITDGLIDQFVIPRLNGAEVSRYDLFTAVEDAKKQILGYNESEAYLDILTKSGDLLSDIVLTQDDVNAVIDKTGIEEQIDEMIRNIFLDTDFDPDDVTNVHFIGGGSYITRFREHIGGIFGITLEDIDMTDDTPIRCVSTGAAAFSEIADGGADIKLREKLNFSVLSNDKAYTYLIKGSYLGDASAIRPLRFSSSDANRKIMRFYQVMADTTDALYMEKRRKSPDDVPPDSIYIGHIDITDMPWSEDAQGFNITLMRDGTFQCGIFGKSGYLGTVELEMED